MLDIRKFIIEGLHHIFEDINIPVSVGDEILTGKFKNKKTKVKSISKNEKGDLTINDKPALKFRIPEKIDESHIDGKLKNTDEEFEKIKNSKFNSLRNFTLNDIVEDWDNVKSIKNDNIDTIEFFIDKIKNKDTFDCLIYDKKGLTDGYHRLIAMKIVGVKQFCFVYDEYFLG